MRPRNRVCMVSFFCACCMTATCGLSQSVVYNEDHLVQGFIQPARRSQVATSHVGVIKKVVVEEGASVKRGDCLFELDDRVHSYRLEQARVVKDARGDIEFANAEVAAKKRRVDCVGELAERKHATPSELFFAEEELALAQANLTRAIERQQQYEAEYRRLLTEVEEHKITAPFDGIVVQLKKEVGEYVGPGDSVVCELVDIERLSVEFVLPKHLRMRLETGDSVDVHFTAASRSVKGKVSYVSPYPNGETSTFVAKVRIENSSASLSAGERCELELSPRTRSDLASTAAVNLRDSRDK